MKTGAPYGQVFDAVDRGCKGGDTNVARTGGWGGGLIFIQVTGILQNDGQISCNGETGQATDAGGGSGGSINMDIHIIKVFICFVNTVEFVQSDTQVSRHPVTSDKYL
jgi:hypothetical protein